MKKITAQLAFSATAIALAVFASPAGAYNRPAPEKFVRTANYFLKAGTDITPEMYPALARYDLLILPAEAQIYNRSMFARLRALNPNIIILAYMPSKSWNSVWVDDLHAALGRGIEDSWWLRDPQGNAVSVWPGTKMISTVSPWQTYLPQFVNDRIMSTGLWDGVFYDEFSATISWVNGGNIDLQRDGIRDDAALADTAWKRATVNLLKKTRELLGPDAIIVTNGDSTAELQPFVNGRMFESFPTPWEAGGTWSGVMKNYTHLHETVGSAPVFIINSTSGNTGKQDDYQKVRFGLASALMADGFFSFDFGDANHGQLWNYDEYGAELGRPLGKAASIGPVKSYMDSGVWRRDFERGTALVNSSDSTQTIALGTDLEKLRGSQDPAVNDGSVVDSVTLPAADGIILVKPLERIVGASYTNGAFTRIFSPAGDKKRNGFFAYDAAFRGSAKVAAVDIDHDGATETVVASGDGTVAVYNADGSRRFSLMPYGPGYKQISSLAVGDLDGDGRDEIVVGPGPDSTVKGGVVTGPKVKVFDYTGRQRSEFMAYSPLFRGGVNVAIGDLYGGGRKAIITGAGPGGGPHVRVFGIYGTVLNNGFFAYAPAFSGGVRVAAGDLDGDGRDEIVTGAGPGGGPHVRVFDHSGRSLGRGFFAAAPTLRDGVDVAVVDTDNDGKMEIAAMTQEVFRIAGR